MRNLANLKNLKSLKREIRRKNKKVELYIGGDNFSLYLVCSNVYKWLAMIPVYKSNFAISSRRAILLGGLFVLFSLALFFSGFYGTVKSAEVNSGEKGVNLEETKSLIKQKREEIKQIQNRISDYNSKIKEQQRKTRTLKRDIAIYQNRISKNELEVKETQLEIEKSEMEIESVKSEIKNKEEKIEKDRKILKNLIKLLYLYEQDSILEVLMTKDNLSDFFNEVGTVEYVKDNIFEAIVDLRIEKENLNSREQELRRQQEQKEQLVQMKFQQNESLSELSVQKRKLLEITKGEEKKFQKILDENKKILPFLKSQLRDLQSLGTKIRFNDAISAAKHVGEITGVRPEFLLGILKVESNLGTNVGGGNYKIDMRSRQRPVFEAITRELGYDPNEMPVSKKPRSYKGWGGAMGPAQMMPTTWRVYQDEVAEITGHYPPDPWDLTDAIAAMAVKVSKVQGVTDGNYDAEYKAAGLYFAGRNWRKFLFYPNRVMLYTNLYAKELN